MSKNENMAMCELTGKRTVVKNLVSHSNIKTKSRAFLNIKKKHLRSSILKQNIRFRLAASTLREIDHKGGLDIFLLKQSNHLLSKKALKVKNQILKKIKTKKASLKGSQSPEKGERNQEGDINHEKKN